MGTQENWHDIAGRMQGKRHILPVRVYFEDTDFSGVVYHASYMRFCERGRSDFMRHIGVDHAKLFASDNEGYGEGHGKLAFAVRHMEIDFLKPARIDDILEVKTSLVSTTGVRLRLEQNVVIGDKHLLKALVSVVLLGDNGRVTRFPNTLLTKLRDNLS